MPGGIWSAVPMQQTCPAPKTPCQLTLQPPSWLVIESALGPVTTTLADGGSGSALFWLRSKVIDSGRPASVLSRPESTAALASLASTHGLAGLLAHGWSNRPSWNFRVRIRRTAWSIRALRDGAGRDVLQDRGLPRVGAEHLHAHVDARVDRLGDGPSQVRRDVVRGLQRGHVLVVADHDALEAQLAAQDVGQQVVRRGGRDSVDRPGIDHDRLGAGVDAAGVRGQDHALQVAQRQQRLIAVVTVDRLRVAGEMLDGGAPSAWPVDCRPRTLAAPIAEARTGSSAQVS